MTCSDEGRPGMVVSVGADPFAPALVRTEQGEENVDVSLVCAVGPGDRVLVHAGFAIATLDDVPANSEERANTTNQADQTGDGCRGEAAAPEARHAPNPPQPEHSTTRQATGEL